jgi:hypothetical protein
MDLSDAIKRRNKRIDKDLVDLMAGRVEARRKLSEFVDDGFKDEITNQNNKKVA